MLLDVYSKRFIFAFFVLLTSCESYHPKPLPVAPTSSSTVPYAVKDPKILAISPWTSKAAQSSQGFTMEQVAALAVLDSPTLKLARDDKGIAEAQAFSAGLLPDPQFGYTNNFPNPHQLDTTTAPNYGLTYDTTALLTRSLVKKENAAAKQQARLTLLWQEWQVISQARVLYVKTIEQNRLLPVLQRQQSLLSARYQHTKQALREGNTTLDVVNADMNALTSLDQQILELKRQMNQTHSDLNSLLGLALTVKVPMSSTLDLSPINDQAINAELAHLIARRPDLLALQAGYQSEDARYRQAIWGQFPAITLNLNYGRDTTNVLSTGFGMSFDIPIFNRNRGNIAIEKATRKKLYDDFESRVNSSVNEVHTLQTDLKLQEQELAETNQALVTLKTAAMRAGTAYQRGDMDEPTYRQFQQDDLNKQVEAINLEENVLLQRIALQTLLGGQLPVST